MQFKATITGCTDIEINKANMDPTYAPKEYIEIDIKVIGRSHNQVEANALKEAQKLAISNPYVYVEPL